MSDTELKQPRWAEVYGGGGLGLLVGVLLGLSATEVVGGVITALMALLATYLGLKGQPGEESVQSGVKSSANQAIRLGSFALVCVLGIFVGLYVRTHNLTGRSIVDQVQQLKDAGYPDSTAQSLVAFRVFGIKPVGAEFTEDAGSKSKVSTSVLFADNASVCAKLDPDNFEGNVAAIFNAWRLEGGAYKVIADSVSIHVSEAAKLSTLKKLWEDRCD